MDSSMFSPVFAEVLKLPMKLLALAKPLRLTTSCLLASSNKSDLLSTKRQGISFPSKNLSSSSTAFFHLIVLNYFNYKIYILSYSFLVSRLVASHITTQPCEPLANVFVNFAFLS